eukprot:Phypoly_transcript_03116.p1 GENE.Phypoly_transcript_03116~~Phypoly_transcript_03116.p1  ORF type:complete len:809 (+),score=167.07 Phypoly_transcript_03116:160-2427(+)
MAKPASSSSLESLDLATQPSTKVPPRRARAKSANGLPPFTPEPEKKSKVRSMLDVLYNPFKLKPDSSHLLPSPLRPASQSSENLYMDKDKDKEASKNKKDCSVTVKVFEARNLPEARLRRKHAEKNIKAFHRAQKMLLEVSSPNLMTFSDATDPYCLVQVEKLKMRTRTIEKKLNPFWCEEFTFEVLDSSMSKVVLTVVDDKKYANQDEVIGRLVIPINAIRDQREREQWLPIQAPISTNKIPQVHMHIDYQQGTAEKKPVFVFQVLGGRNLGLGVTGIPFLDFSWKVKDAPTTEESHAWNDIHSSKSERELQGPLETFNLTLWRWMSHEDEEEEDPSPPPLSLSPAIPKRNSGERKKIILGQISIPPAELSAPRDQWFCLYGRDAGLGDLRVKIKYTEEVVLTLEQYSDLLSLLLDPNLTIVHTLGAVAKPNTREGIAYNLVRVFEKTDKAALLLNGLNREEIESTKNPDIIFRGNSLATKSVDQYMKLVGMPYLSFMLKGLIKKLYASSRSCEVDPSKLDKSEDLKQNWKNLLYWVNLFTDSIFDSLHKCPLSFRQIFNGIQQECNTKFPGNVARYTAISGFIFLRFICPAILAPKLFNLAPDHPGIKQTRYLILIAKTLQNLANLVEFGGVKEEFMKNMNEFVLANLDNMRNFIDKLATIPDPNAAASLSPPPSVKAERTGSDSGGPPPEIINLEKELASMYRHVLRHRDEMVEYHKTKGDAEGLAVMDKLHNILAKLEEEVKIANASEESN